MAPPASVQQHSNLLALSLSSGSIVECTLQIISEKICVCKYGFLFALLSILFVHLKHVNKIFFRQVKYKQQNVTKWGYYATDQSAIVISMLSNILATMT